MGNGTRGTENDTGHRITAYIAHTHTSVTANKAHTNSMCFFVSHGAPVTPTGSPHGTKFTAKRGERNTAEVSHTKPQPRP